MITFEEMEAINVYTGNNYTVINGILRYDNQDLSLMHALIASVMAASGIRKLPATVIKDTYRQTSVFALPEQIKVAAERAIFTLSGFVSSSTKQGQFNPSSPMNFHYTNVTGIYIAPISQYQHESEFLMLPGQFRYVGYCQTENKMHYFEVEPVSTVMPDLIEETAPNNGWLSTINRALQWGFGFFADDNDLTEDETPSPTTPVMPIQRPLFLKKAMESLHTKVQTLDQEKQVDITKGTHLRRYETAEDLERQLNELMAQYFERREINLQKFKDDCHLAIEDARDALTDKPKVQGDKPKDQWDSLLNWLQFAIQQLIHKVSFGYFFKELYTNPSPPPPPKMIDELKAQVNNCQEVPVLNLG